MTWCNMQSEDDILILGFSLGRHDFEEKYIRVLDDVEAEGLRDFEGRCVKWFCEVVLWRGVVKGCCEVVLWEVCIESKQAKKNTH